MRALETHYGKLLSVQYVMGGLIKHIDDFYDPQNAIGDVASEEFNKQVTRHWEEAQHIHGMPVRADLFDLYSDEYPSTYPQNIAYKAAELVNPDLAPIYLYRMRKAVSTQGKAISHEDVQIELASEVGLEISAFIQHLKDGSAEKAFHKDLAKTQAAGVTGFPTLEIAYKDQSLLLNGYRSFTEIASVIDYISKGAVKPREVHLSKDNLVELLRKHPVMTLKEVQIAFDIPTIAQTEVLLEDWFKDNTISKETVGQSYFISLSHPQKSYSCDPETGICHF